MSRQAVSKHFAVLERAGLVVVLQRGREKRLLPADGVRLVRRRAGALYDGAGGVGAVTRVGPGGRWWRVGDGTTAVHAADAHPGSRW
jgi:DNA-binding transcriptional ArsR family regulator